MKRLTALAVLLALPLQAAVPTYTPELQARVFDRAWSLVAKHYWDRSRTGEAWADARDHFRPLAVAASDRPAFYTLLGEMLASLGDSHVYAIDPLQISIGRARDAGRAEQGFGLAMSPDDNGHWLVTRVAAGSSAAKAGVEIGWEVRAVNGKPVDIDYQPTEGEQASFDFDDEHGARHSLDLIAAPEPAQLVRRATRLPDNILLVGLDGFDSGADRWLARTIAQGPPPAAIVLDLRGNDGGDADVIAKVAGLFFAEDRPLVRRIERRENVQKVRGTGERAYRGPLAVLIGPNSASGAEALAALVDESGRGTTVGERTAGALTGASEYKLPDGGELSVAEFDIRTPDGRRLEGVGLEPKIAVKPSLADLRAGRDPVLDRALEVVRGGQLAARR
ncbi:S41 family peptidase [Sphingomonas crusticola]|uniref:S41 family peptidase n=1 Tax=Sphingomonas crusticola TaxID=1697973 RepID=UPI000E25B9F1|nr:S41 family peptidase [Sphingomonas crusticola]